MEEDKAQTDSAGSPASTPAKADVAEALAQLYRAESRRVLATLVRLLGDIDLAEEALQEAFAAALRQWPRDGVPENPRAWLVSAGRFKAIDQLRKKARYDNSLPAVARTIESQGLREAGEDSQSPPGSALEDDRLRLIFLCCHPANPPDAQVALTLREVCGLSSEEIAEAYLVELPTLAKRIVRAKARLREERIPYELPPLAELPARLEAVLKVVYLVFNEGYSASSGNSLVRAELSAEALRLGRLLAELLPDPEVSGLLALMLLQESRRKARVSPEGELLLLDEQDRGLWDTGLLNEGLSLVESALAAKPEGFYTLQAAIAAEHAAAPRASATDWPKILLLYRRLFNVAPTPVIELNLAIALAFAEDTRAGLRRTQEIMNRGDLADFHLAHSVQAELYRRLGDIGEARAAYQKALGLARQEPERRFLQKKLKELEKN